MLTYNKQLKSLIKENKRLDNKQNYRNFFL